MLHCKSFENNDDSNLLFRQEIETSFDISPYILGYAKADLSDNMCCEIVGFDDYVSTSALPVPLDRFFGSLTARIAGTEYIPNVTKELSTEQLLSAFDAGQYSVSVDAPFFRPHGGILWLTIYAKLSKSKSDGKIYARFYCINTHERKIAQLIIDIVMQQEYDTQFYIDLDSNSAKIFSGDGNVYWGDPYPIEQIDANIEAYLREHYIGEDREKFIEENRIPYIAKLMENKSSHCVEYMITEEDGKPHLKRGSYYWLDSTHRLLFFARADITKLSLQEKARRDALENALDAAKAANSKLQQAIKAKDEFFNRMSHDIRTPMNAIIGMTSLALDEVNNPDAVTDYLGKINSSSHFLLGLINDLLDMTKIENGSMALTPEPYYYLDFLENIKTMFEPQCIKNGITLNIAAPTHACVIMADKIRLNQIFFNIMSNAVKFTPEGGSIVYRTENFTSDSDSMSCDYIISDTGIGISKEFMSKLFTPFCQENNSISSKLQGTGLGLSIAKSLTEQMGGYLKIDSEQGKGTTVTIHLSFPIAKKTAVPSAATADSYRSATLVGKRILLIEDHPLNTEIAKKLLEKRGAIVYTAENGKIGFETFSASSVGLFSAVLMDIRMPIMDGLTSARMIRALDRPDARTTPIIAMTANAYREDIALSKASGMNAHLAKPIDPNILFSTLTSLLSD